MIVPIIIELFLIVLGFMLPKSKVASLLLLVFMWILYSFNTYSGDYEVYRVFYEETTYSYLFLHFEPGFASIMGICRLMELSFSAYKMVLGTVFIVLLHFAIRRYTKFEALVLAIFIIFPFTYYISVLRAGIAMLIITFSFKYLASKKKFSLLKFIFVILFATLFHYSSLLFLVLILLRKGKVIMNLAIVFLITITVTILMYTGVLYNLASLVISNQEILDWLDVSTSNNELTVVGQLTQVAILFMTIFVMYYINKTYFIFKKSSELDSEYMRKKALTKSVFKANLALLVFIPFFMITDVWMRMIWTMILINIIVCVEIPKKRYSFSRNGCVKSVRANYSQAMMLALIVICAIYANLPYVGTEISYEYFYINNSVFSQLGL